MKQSLILTLLATAMLAGCADRSDPANDAPSGPDGRLVATFENPQPASATGFEHVAQLQHNGTPFSTGSGNWVQGDYVYGSAQGQGFFIADVSDPANPIIVYLAGDDSLTAYARKAQVVTHPDGRLTLALATQGDGMHLWNVTDPHNPEFAARLDELNPNHNVMVVPGTEFVFNGPSRGAGTSNQLVDVSDPYAPVVVGEFGTHGCHDTTFHGTYGEPGFRAYCAGIQRTEIWDLDGLDPTAAGGLGIRLVAAIESTDSPITGSAAFTSYPVRTLHHLAMVNEAATVLIIGDEHNGGGTPGACYGQQDAAGRTVSTPFGALWFYDITNEATPEMLGWISPPTVAPGVNPGVPPTPDPASIDPNNPNSVINAATTPLRPYLSGVPNCTAHFGTIVPGEEKLVMAWYTAGVLLIDFSDPSNPRMLDQFQPEGINVWNARVHNGYVFTGDLGRGMDVLKLV